MKVLCFFVIFISLSGCFFNSIKSRKEYFAEIIHKPLEVKSECTLYKRREISFQKEIPNILYKGLTANDSRATAVPIGSIIVIQDISRYFTHEGGPWLGKYNGQTIY